ncbi:MAG: ribonuclease H-like domain-containing protein [Planctomycetes bacterium]|nr:ribonuclease H-like domain-containing protein [Planctomycetota bacterium]
MPGRPVSGAAGAPEDEATRRRLERAFREGATAGGMPRPCRLIEDIGATLEQLVPGVELRTPSGPVWSARIDYPRDHACGRTALSSLVHSSREHLAWLGRDERLAELDWSRTLFLDTETTGLAGGTGTYAFLVGLARWRDGAFRLTQYFMRDFDEEPALLLAVRDEIEAAGAIVTYNGKCFDAPLLDTRFGLNRLPVRLAGRPHLDLLFPARRLWKRRAGDCSLINLQAQILGVERVDDVDGAEIPGIYYDFVRTGRADRLARVFAHNAEDLVSLAALTVRASMLAQDPLGQPGVTGAELFSVGTMLAREGRNDASRSCLEAAIEIGLDETGDLEALWRLSLVYKRQKRWSEAARIWRTLLDDARARPAPLGAVPILSLLEELARHAEHVEHDTASAARWTREARPMYKDASGSVKTAWEKRAKRVEAAPGGDHEVMNL